MATVLKLHAALDDNPPMKVTWLDYELKIWIGRKHSQTVSD